ncbi:MAG: carbon-nitrogen hydrolase family protein [Spirochaetes bacterium]|nr:MAG: carbon-nitrogen hydrolase family protein [Spirochaetota bacterium]
MVSPTVRQGNRQTEIAGWRPIESGVYNFESGRTYNMFKLAMIQMLVIGGEREENLNHAVSLIEKAANQGAEIALLPECLDLGWTHPSSGTLSAEIPDGKNCRALRKAAADNKILVCAGLTERAGDKVYNAAVLIDDLGEVILKHRKINELDIGTQYYSTGDRLNVIDTSFGRIGLMICADGFVEGQVLSRSLCRMGAEVILSPCAWAVRKDHNNAADPYGDFWREVYVPVAVEFSTTIIGVSNVGAITGGPWEGRKCIGCSLAIGPDGEDIIQGPYGINAETILLVEVEIQNHS